MREIIILLAIHSQSCFSSSSLRLPHAACVGVAALQNGSWTWARGLSADVGVGLSVGLNAGLIVECGRWWLVLWVCAGNVSGGTQVRGRVEKWGIAATPNVGIATRKGVVTCGLQKVAKYLFAKVLRRSPRGVSVLI